MINFSNTDYPKKNQIVTIIENATKSTSRKMFCIVLEEYKTYILVEDLNNGRKESFLKADFRTGYLVFKVHSK